MKNVDNLRNNLYKNALRTFGKELDDCNIQEKYTVLSASIMEEVLPQWMESINHYKDRRQAYYFSAEYLMGRALSNNLMNLDSLDDIKSLLEEMGLNYNEIEELEP